VRARVRESCVCMHARVRAFVCVGGWRAKKFQSTQYNLLTQTTGAGEPAQEESLSSLVPTSLPQRPSPLVHTHTHTHGVASVRTVQRKKEPGFALRSPHKKTVETLPACVRDCACVCVCVCCVCGSNRSMCVCACACVCMCGSNRSWTKYRHSPCMRETDFHSFSYQFPRPFFLFFKCNQVAKDKTLSSTLFPSSRNSFNQEAAAGTMRETQLSFFSRCNQEAATTEATKETDLPFILFSFFP